MLVTLNPVSVLEIGSSLRPVFAQAVTFQFGAAGILGLCLAGAGAGLYLLRSTRPELARDYDIFFSAIGLLCGGILFFNGWRLDPILMFCQVLMGGSAVFFAFDSIRLRSITTDQARRGGGREPIVDEDRYAADRVYRAELDEIEPFMEDRPPIRRIRGSRDNEDRAAYRDSYARDSSADNDYSDDSYSNDSYSSESSYSSPGYSGRSTSRRSSRRRPRADRSGDYGASSAYDAGYQKNGETESQGRSDYGSNYGSEDRTDSSSSATRRRSAVSDWETPAESRRTDPSRRRNSSSRDRDYDDEPPVPRSGRRSRSESARESRRSRDNTDDYVDYKPITNYSGNSSSSSTYGSRRPSRDYDDEWGAS